MNPLKIIRWKFVIPVGLLAAAVIAFFVFLFDPLLTRIIETVGAKFNEAKVDVVGLNTKIFKGRLDIANLQVADRKSPMKNRVEMGPMTFQLDPLELLKMRFVIPESSINGIAFNTDRKTSGALPVKRRKAKDDEAGIVAKLGEKYEGRFDVTLKNVETDVKGRIEFDPKDTKVAKKADSIEGRVNALPDEYESKVKNLDVENRIKKIGDEIESLKNTPTDGTEAITAIPAALKKLNQAKADLKQIKADVNGLASNLKSDVSTLQSDVKSLKSLKDEDIQDLLGRLNLDFADPKRLAEGILGQVFLDRAQKALGVIEMARKHMPSKKEKDSLPVHPRAEGMTIEFPRPADPPKFWLKNASLSGRFEDIDASGALVHLNTDPPRVGKPTELKLKGIRDNQTFSLNIFFDHVTEIKKDGFTLMAQNVKATKLIQSGLFGKALSDGSGNGEVMFQLVGKDGVDGRISFNLGKLKFKRDVVFSELGLDPKATSVKDDIKNTFANRLVDSLESVDRVEATAIFGGTVLDPTMTIKTNLETVFSGVIKSTLGSAVQEQRKKLEARLNSIVAEEQKKLQAQLDKAQGKLNGQLGGLTQKVDEEIQKATGINLSPAGGDEKSPIPGLKIPSLDKIFK